MAKQQHMSILQKLQMKAKEKSHDLVLLCSCLGILLSSCKQIGSPYLGTPLFIWSNEGERSFQADF